MARYCTKSNNSPAALCTVQQHWLIVYLCNCVCWGKVWGHKNDKYARNIFTVSATSCILFREEKWVCIYNNMHKYIV